MPLAVLGALTGAGFVASDWWPLEIPAHFRPQLAVACLVVLALAAMLRARRAAAGALVLALANAAPLVPYAGSAFSATAAGPGDLKVLTLNLWGRRTDPQAFQELLRREDPDIVLLTELPRSLRHLLSGLDERYPYQLLERHASSRDVMLLSRWRPVRWEFDRSSGPSRPVLAADLCPEAGEPCVRLIGLHAVRPFGHRRANRDRQYAAAARLAAAGPHLPTVLMGDLNVTPWAASFARLLEESGLEDASGQRRGAATWRSRSLLLGLPLDHILTSPEVAVIDSYLGRNVGSDHFPVVARLAIRPAAGTSRPDRPQNASHSPGSRSDASGRISAAPSTRGLLTRGSTGTLESRPEGGGASSSEARSGEACSQSSQASADSASGMRSCSEATSALAGTVTIVHETRSSLRLRSHNPANASGAPSVAKK